MMSIKGWVAGLSVVCLLSTGAEAAGCLKGAAVGGVAGHFAGHHAVLGALAGCAVGHHRATVQRRRDGERQQNRPEPDNESQTRM